MADGDSATKAAAARLMELIGERSDVASLRRLSRELKGEHRNPELGRALARRVAPRAFVEDLGRIELKIGDRPLPGTSIRRKALALLTFLLAQPRMSATRDQVLDALWPDQDPGQAANSLHQTVYFLRRVFEPAYSDDLSPGYLHHDPDVLWLDPELIDSRSQLATRINFPNCMSGALPSTSHTRSGRFPSVSIFMPGTSRSLSGRSTRTRIRGAWIERFAWLSTRWRSTRSSTRSNAL
jgi:hypothetical protein